jgi:two-component system response regulator DesR
VDRARGPDLGECPIDRPRDTSGPSDRGVRTRVLCIDDSRDLTDALARLVAMQPDMEDAGVLNSADGLIAEVMERRATVIVMDLTMPGVAPLVAIRELSDKVPTCRVIAFSGYDDAETRQFARQAGAAELVSKIAPGGALLQAIRRVAAGIPRSGVDSLASRPE